MQTGCCAPETARSHHTVDRDPLRSPGRRNIDKPGVPDSGRSGRLGFHSENELVDKLKGAIAEEFGQFRNVVTEHAQSIRTAQQELLDKQREAFTEHLSKFQTQLEQAAPPQPTTETKLKEEPASPTVELVSLITEPCPGVPHQPTNLRKSKARGPKSPRGAGSVATIAPGMNAPVREESQESNGEGGGQHKESFTARLAVQQGMILRRIFEIREQDDEDQKLAQLEGRFGAIKKDMETAIDAAIGVVISLNALYIGFSMDYADTWPKVILSFEIAFTTLFTLEIIAKVLLKGAVAHFCHDKASSFFDLSLVTVDLTQIVFAAMFPSAAEGMGDTPVTKFLRMLKIVKLVRLLRLLKSPVFNDLVAMVRGIMLGMTTLGWAIIIFVVVCYVQALLWREAFGRNPDEALVFGYFANVPRSMYTMFRCSLGDCSSISGTPIFEHVQDAYGSFFSLVYCCYWFFVTVGIFNVISAIFVESTLAAGQNIELAKKKARIANETLWATRVTTIIKGLIEASPGHTLPRKLTQQVEEISGFEIPSQCLDDAVCDPDVAKALAELDIDPDDNARLSDILDPDNGGTIAVADLIDGLRRLRGEPKRSDIIAVDLMIRSIQSNINDILDMVQHLPGSPLASLGSVGAFAPSDLRNSAA